MPHVGFIAKSGSKDESREKLFQNEVTKTQILFFSAE